MPRLASVTALRPLEEVISAETRGRRRRWIVGLLVSLTIVAAGVVLWLVARPRPPALVEQFEFATVEQGGLTREVVATGRLEARGAVEVGAEISGRVASVEVDHEQRVEAGQTLLRFDTETLDAEVAKARAAVASAKAEVAKSKVSVLEAERRESQAQALHLKGFESHENYAATRSATELAEAQREAAEAQLAARRASYELARTQAAKAAIESPIDGVVISRYVDPGQTVAATFQTPVLFVIAEQLVNMEVRVPIDEADIGEVKVGQRATFTVDAQPDRVFEAVVTQLRSEAKVVESVVTYDAVLEVANPELLLRPGMTASVRIETARAEDTLYVPNAALRFVPPAALAGDAREAEGEAVWVVRDGELVRLSVETGVASGRFTELHEAGRAGLSASDEVIVELSEVGRAQGQP